MATFSLDQIRAAADAKYGSLDIPLSDKPGDVVRLLNPLRMSEEQRKELQVIQNKLNDAADKDSGEDEQASEDAIAAQTELIKEMLLAVAENKQAGQKLLDALNGDLAMTMVVFEQYTEGTQLGEASASQS